MEVHLTSNCSLSSLSYHAMGSKYLANRALMIAALADGYSEVNGVPISQDMYDVFDVLTQLGIKFECRGHQVFIEGCNGQIPWPRQLRLGDNGTLARFVGALSALSHTAIELLPSKQLSQRPMHDLIVALKQAGVTVLSEQWPIKLHGPISCESIFIESAISSQYLSGLLIMACASQQAHQIVLQGPMVSKGYIDLTVDTLRQFGAVIEPTASGWSIPAGQLLKAQSYQCCSDVVGLSYVIALAIIRRQMLVIDGIHLTTREHCELETILSLLNVQWSSEGCQLRITPSKKPIVAFEIDANSLPDWVPTLAVLATFAAGASRITNVTHLRYKESDRLLALQTEFAKMNLSITMDGSDMLVQGGCAQSAALHSHDDHRIAMSLALLVEHKQPITITSAEAVNKSQPTFWDDLQRLGVNVRVDK